MSISRRLSIWTFLSLLFICTVALYVHYRLISSEVVKHLEDLGDTVGLVIETAIADSMLTRNTAILNSTLHKLTEVDPIIKILVVNDSGTIKAGTDDQDIGKTLQISKTPCPRFYEKGRTSIFLKDENIFRWIQPIKNRNECHACHDPRRNFLGLL